MNPVTIQVDRASKRDYALRIIGKLPVEDGEIWEVRVGKYVPRRTLQQNNRLHLIFSKVALATGGDIESVKQGYKEMFLAPKETTFHGRKIKTWPKTSEMKRDELATFMDQVESDGISSWGVILEHD